MGLSGVPHRYLSSISAGHRCRLYANQTPDYHPTTLSYQLCRLRNAITARHLPKERPLRPNRRRDHVALLFIHNPCCLLVTATLLTNVCSWSTIHITITERTSTACYLDRNLSFPLLLAHIGSLRNVALIGTTMRPHPLLLPFQPAISILLLSISCTPSI